MYTETLWFMGIYFSFTLCMHACLQGRTAAMTAADRGHEAIVQALD